MKFISAKYEARDHVPEYAKDEYAKNALWGFRVETDGGDNFGGLLRRVDIDDDIIFANSDGTCWQARHYQNTPWAEPASTREGAIQNLVPYLKIGPEIDRSEHRPEQQSQEAESNPFEKLLGAIVSDNGLVAPVDPADMRSLYQIGRETRAAVGSTGLAVDMSILQSACSPGANALAVWYRLMMLGLCDYMGLLPGCRLDGEFTDTVFRVAATIPMKQTGIGVVTHGPPFDIEEFVKQVERASAE